MFVFCFFCRQSSSMVADCQQHDQRSKQCYCMRIGTVEAFSRQNIRGRRRMPHLLFGFACIKLAIASHDVPNLPAQISRQLSVQVVHHQSHGFMPTVSIDFLSRTSWSRVFYENKHRKEVHTIDAENEWLKVPCCNRLFANPSFRTAIATLSLARDR
jgi:hypothetical protein